jgi:uncharacterized membrane protein YqjE
VIHLRQLGPAFIRHVEAYGLLAGAALRDTGSEARKRASLVAAGAVLGIAFVILAGATAIAAGWGTEYRWWVALAVLGALAIGTAVCLSRAFASMPRSSHLQALRDEWQKDKAWLGRDRNSRLADPGTSPALQGVPRTGDTARPSARAQCGG